MMVRMQMFPSLSHHFVLVSSLTGPDLIHHPMTNLSMHDAELSLSPSNLYATTRGLRSSEESEHRDPSVHIDEPISLAQAEGTIV